jgi:hypothetical protein
MRVSIVMTRSQYHEVLHRLFPSNSRDEHFGCAIAGISTYPGGCNLLLRAFFGADESCLIKQSGASVRPDPCFVEYIWTLAEKSRSSLIDFHTHPFCDTHVRFSPIDDRDDRDGFPKVVARLGHGPHASVVLGRESLDARWYDSSAKSLQPISRLRIIGENLHTIVPTSARHSGSAGVG